MHVPQPQSYIHPYVRSGLNSHYFHIIGDGHQPNSRGLYTHYKDSLLKGGMTIPNTRSLDPGSHGLIVNIVNSPTTKHGAVFVFRLLST